MALTAAQRTLKCDGCGFEAPVGDDWNRIEHPPVGVLTQCPECGSTRVHSRRSESA